MGASLWSHGCPSHPGSAGAYNAGNLVEVAAHLWVTSADAAGGRFGQGDEVGLVEAYAADTGVDADATAADDVLEDERRRIRRDLPDGLGPALTAVTLHLDLVGSILRDDPNRAEAMVIELRREVSDAIADIRRLVHELRPPTLDELGLLGALREHARRLGRDVTMTIEAEELPHLPAAVEVAAYRIAVEAMTNVARHSRATTCNIRVTYDGSLTVEVEDDGIGCTETWRPGVGLRSMSARATELGGICAIGAARAGGGSIRATLPVAP